MAHLSVREAATELGVHPARVTHWIASGRLRADWIDGPHGPTRRIDSAALASLRREIVGGPSPSAGDSTFQSPSSGDALARARAVESYTAGLAATAIAPAVSRLVETIEHLTRENGDLREEIGALKARLDARSTSGPPTEDVDEPPSQPTDGESNGLSQEQWESLRVRLERLSEPIAATEQPASYESEPPPVAGETAAESRRGRRPTLWGRLTDWIRGNSS
jgi:hypothetical protein